MKHIKNSHPEKPYRKPSGYESVVALPRTGACRWCDKTLSNVWKHEQFHCPVRKAFF